MELVDKQKMMRYKALFEKHMSDPIKLRLTTMAILFIVFFGAIYWPLSKKIDENRRRLAAEKERNGYIVDYEKLDKQAGIFHSLISENLDTNEWVKYLLDGLRQYKVKLKTMESRQPRKVGPYRAVSFSMEIEGTYPELKNYIEWMESSQRLIRIDMLQFEKRSDNILMKMLVLAVVPQK
ncbi:MAG: GspMb/PilO family protein [Sedimentisphaerales bacterium]